MYSFPRLFTQIPEVGNLPLLMTTEALLTVATEWVQPNYPTNE